MIKDLIQRGTRGMGMLRVVIDIGDFHYTMEPELLVLTN